LQEKDKRISELEDLLKFKAKLVRKDGMYFESDENGDLTGEPYCSNCWEVSNKVVHLLSRETNYDYLCPNCNNGFGPRSYYSRSSRS
jgi:hypothetical protein